VFLPRGHLRGMKQILVSEWGPLDPATPYVFPRSAFGWGTATHRLGGGVDSVQVVGDFDTERPDGLIRVGTEKDGLFAYRGEAVFGKKLIKFDGVLLGATWHIRHWAWTQDPREHWAIPADAPTAKARRLSFSWGSGGPGALRDRFGTQATTSVPLPKGQYEIRTVSDDGIRVRVNGKLLIDDWTHHAPRAHTAKFAADGATAIEIEHFELDGWAMLRFELRPVR
jgi:hypothetical protein